MGQSVYSEFFREFSTDHCRYQDITSTFRNRKEKKEMESFPVGLIDNWGRRLVTPLEGVPQYFILMNFAIRWIFDRFFLLKEKSMVELLLSEFNFPRCLPFLILMVGSFLPILYSSFQLLIGRKKLREIE